MVIDPERREMFTDLYRLAEFYEKPPFQPGDVEQNANWFVKAQEEQLDPFLQKHHDQMAVDLALAIVEDANRQAKQANSYER